MFKNQQNQILDKYFCMLSTLNDLLFRVWLEFCCIRLPVISFGRLFPVNFLKTEKPGIGKIFSKWNWIKGLLWKCYSPTFIFHDLFLSTGETINVNVDLLKGTKGEPGFPGNPGIPGRDGLPGLKGDRGKKYWHLSNPTKKNCIQSVVHSLTFSFKFCKRIFSVFAAQ